MKPIIKAGLTLGLASLAADFIFGPDCDIKDILPKDTLSDADVPKKKLAALSNIDPNYLVTGSVGVAASINTDASYRTAKSLLDLGGIGAPEADESI